MNTLQKNKTFKEKFYKEYMPKIYGFGAAIVIAGAMFKLLNWPGGAFMLGLGLSVEAAIFILSAFEPDEKDLKWEKVYPQLSDSYNLNNHVENMKKDTKNNESVSEKLDDLFQKAKFDVTLVKNLGIGIEKLSESVENMSDISKKSNVLHQYLDNIEKANQTINEMQKVFSKTSNAMQLLGGFEQNLQVYTQHMQSTSKNVGAINQFYKQVLENKKENFQNTEKSKEIFDQFIQHMQKTTEGSSRFENELNMLNEKISSLNDMYGKMLTVMKK